MDMKNTDWKMMGTGAHSVKFIIPAGEKRKWWQFWKKSESKKAEETLADTIAKYREEIRLPVGPFESIHHESWRYVDRLEREWRKHGKIIIACDFDDTVHPWGIDDFEFQRVIDLIIKAQSIGAHFVIFTAGKTSRFEYMTKYLTEKGIRVDSVNKNPIELPFGNHSKVYANIFLDDRAGLMESLSILNLTIQRIQANPILSNDQNQVL